MLTIIQTAVNAVVPVVLLILLGYFLKQRNFLTKEFIKVGNRLVFRCCLPAMLFVNVYSIGDLASIAWDVMGYCTGMIVVMCLVGIAAAHAVTRDPGRRGVLIQCAFRSNYALIGIPLITRLAGSSGAAVGAVLSAFSIPTFNILAVIILSRYGGEGRRRGTALLKSIVTNPLLIGVCGGLFCILVRSAENAVFGQVVLSLKEDIPVVYAMLDSLKAIASPFALIVLGGQFEFTAVRGLWKEITTGVLLRNVTAPALSLGAAVWLAGKGLLQCAAPEYAAMMALFATPTAVSSAVMAEEMGCAPQLAAQLVVWTSATSAFTMVAVVFLMLQMHLL